MIYLIGGVARAGKSQFSKKLAQELNIARIDFDDIVNVFHDVVPEYDLFRSMDQDKREAKAYPIISTLINLYVWRNEDLIIEGDIFDIKNWNKYKTLTSNNVKMLVFGYSEISPETKLEINTKTTQNTTCWFEPLTDVDKLRIAREMIDRSLKIKKVVHQINDPALKYFETHNDFESTLNDALTFCKLRNSSS